MFITKVKLGAAVLAGGLVASFLIRHHAHVQLHRLDERAREQEEQFAELTSEHQRLSNQVAQAANSAVEPPTAELERLRRQAAALEQRTNLLAKEVQARAREQHAHLETRPPHPPEYYQQLRRMSAGKVADARTLGLLFATYAVDHQGEFPTNYDEVSAYLTQQHQTLTGTNQFDLLFRGSPGKLAIPRGEIAVLRERQAWPGPDGKMTRVYVMADGSVQTIESDDDFKAWEAEHVLPANTTSQ